jgi:hypothetical protein
MLLSILGAVIAGGTVSFSKSALAREPDLDRYVRVISLQRDLYDHANAIRLKIQQETGRLMIGDGGEKLPAWITDDVAGDNSITTKSDELFGYMLLAFPHNGETTIEHEMLCSDFFEKRLNPDTMTVEGLQSVLPVIVPVIVARRILTMERISFNILNMKNWQDFVNKYQRMLLQGTKRPHSESAILYPDWGAENFSPEIINAVRTFHTKYGYYPDNTLMPAPGSMKTNANYLRGLLA